MEKEFTFSAPDAIEIAYIIQCNQDNPQFLHEILIHAWAFEKAYQDKQKK